MLDFELAEIYGYETKRFNEQVKNNIEKFDDDFRFQLTKEKWEFLRSKFSTSKAKAGSEGRRYLPHAFTEQGIYMLMTVLKGELAVKQSKALIHTFNQMKDYITENHGQPIEANLAYKDIYSIEKKSIYIVDNYIGVKNLVLLKDLPSLVAVIIFSDNIGKGLHALEYQDFCQEYPFRKITFQKFGGEFHDRYIIIDRNTEHQRIYHCGASSKDAGQRITSIWKWSIR